MSNELRYNLDTSIINYTGKRCKQNDDRTLVLTLFDKAIPFVVTGATLSLKAMRSNDTFVIQDTELSLVGNIVTIPMVRDITRVAGQVKLELKITLAARDITTFTFMLEVEPSVISDGSVASTNVITALEGLENKINDGKLLLTDLDGLIDNANSTAYELDNTIDDVVALNNSAILTRNSLVDKINNAESVNDALTEDTNLATTVKGLLGNMVTDATNVSIPLNESITNGISTTNTLNTAIDNGEYIRNSIVQVSEDANYYRGELQDLINEANTINLTPIGSIVMFPSVTMPNGWKLADGQAVSRATYAALFSAIGTLYGAGDGSTTFNLPNLKGRIPVGLDSAETEFDTLGEVGGTKTNTLIESNLPAHTHAATATTDLTCNATGNFTIKATATGGNTAIPDSNSYLAQPNKVGATTINNYNNNTAVTKEVDMGGGSVTVNGTVGGTVNVTNASVGSATPVNNIQPYIVLNYIIRAI